MSRHESAAIGRTRARHSRHPRRDLAETTDRSHGWPVPRDHGASVTFDKGGQATARVVQSRDDHDGRRKFRERRQDRIVSLAESRLEHTVVRRFVSAVAVHDGPAVSNRTIDGRDIGADVSEGQFEDRRGVGHAAGSSKNAGTDGIGVNVQLSAVIAIRTSTVIATRTARGDEAVSRINAMPAATATARRSSSRSAPAPAADRRSPERA